MKTVLESVDKLIENSIINATMHKINAAANSMFQRYEHASPHTIREFLLSFFNNSHHEKIWEEIIDKRIISLIDDIKTLNNGNVESIKELLKSFKDSFAAYGNAEMILKKQINDLSNVLNSNFKLMDDVDLERVESFTKSLKSNHDLLSNIHEHYISQDNFIKLIFLKHFGFNNIQHYVDGKFMTKIKEIYESLVGIIENNGDKETVIKDIKEYLIDPKIIGYSFSEITSLRTILMGIFFEVPIIKALLEYFKKLYYQNSNPQIEPIQVDDSSSVIAAAAAAASILSGLGAYGLYKKHQNKLVRFKNLI